MPIQGLIGEEDCAFTAEPVADTANPATSKQRTDFMICVDII